VGGADGVIGRDDDRAGLGQQRRYRALAGNIDEGAAREVQDKRGGPGDRTLINMHRDGRAAAADIEQFRRG